MTVSIRPEQMRLTHSTAHNGHNVLTGTPRDSTFLGEASEHVLIVNGHPLRFISTPPMFQVPEKLSVEFDPEDVVLLSE